MFKYKTNTKSGITLIALVVTIIVLLILAGISVQMLTGDNGILQRAGEAKEKTEFQQEKEQIILTYNELKVEKVRNGDNSIITADEFENTMKKYDSESKTEAENSKIVITLSNGNKYCIYNNGIITEYSTTPYAKHELMVTELGDTVDSPYYVNYPSAKGNIKCRVLYNDNKYGLELVAVNSLTRVKLGKNDPNENVEGDMGSIDRAINSYNRAITTLNEKAEEYIDTVDGSILAIDARCVGSKPSNKNYPDNLTGTEREEQMYYATDEEEYAKTYDGTLFKTDNNFIEDVTRMRKAGILNYSDNTYGSYYWLATRNDYYHDGHKFSIILQSRKNAGRAIWGFLQIKTNGEMINSSETQYGFRPVLKLSSEVKIIGGKGTEDEPFQIGL